MGRAAAVSLDALRDRIRALEGSPVQIQRQPSGVSVLDDLVGGLPVPGLVELHGARGTGRTRLALAMAAHWTRRHRPVAWVDGSRTLHPPAAADHGVDLDVLLVVRPTADRAVWAVEQLLRAGCFALVVVSDPGRLGRAGQAWARAAETGGCTGVVLTPSPRRTLPAAVRLAVDGERVVVSRNRGGRVGAEAPLPRWPDRARPWR